MSLFSAFGNGLRWSFSVHRLVCRWCGFFCFYVLSSQVRLLGAYHGTHLLIRGYQKSCWLLSLRCLGLLAVLLLGPALRYILSMVMAGFLPSAVAG